MRNAAEDWNSHIPIGTRVIAYPGITPQFAAEMGITDYPKFATVTRSKAWNLGHGEPVVLVNELAGGISLEHVDTDPDLEVWRALRLENAQRSVTEDENQVLQTHKAHQSALDRLTRSLSRLEAVVAELEATSWPS